MFAEIDRAGYHRYLALFFVTLSLLFTIGCSEQTNNGSAVQYRVPHQQTTQEKSLPPENTLFLTDFFDRENSLHKSSFNCDDKIYAVIQFKNHPSKLHQIEIEWKDPTGETREHNRFPYFVSHEIDYAWAALQLHRSVGAGMLQWINPAAGMEEFIGEWTATIKIENLLEDKIVFEVLC